MDAVSLRELTLRLPSSSINSLRQTSTQLNELSQDLDKDWYLWKVKLEDKFNRQVSWMNVNWKYTYILFEDSDPYKVALEYCYDVRIVKLAYELGADFNKDTANLKLKSISDIRDSQRYEGTSRISVYSNIYASCVYNEYTETLRWLLANTLPSKLLLNYLIGEGYTNKDIVATFYGLQSSKLTNRVVLDSNVDYIFVEECFDEEARSKQIWTQNLRRRI